MGKRKSPESSSCWHNMDPLTAEQRWASQQTTPKRKYVRRQQDVSAQPAPARAESTERQSDETALLEQAISINDSANFSRLKSIAIIGADGLVSIPLVDERSEDDYAFLVDKMDLREETWFLSGSKFCDVWMKLLRSNSARHVFAVRNSIDKASVVVIHASLKWMLQPNPSKITDTGVCKVRFESEKDCILYLKARIEQDAWIHCSGSSPDPRVLMKIAETLE